MLLGVAPKNRYQNDMCIQEIELYAQNIILTILGSIVNIIGGTYMTT